MSVAINSFTDTFAFICMTQAIAMLVLDRVSLASRMRAFLGNSYQAPLYWVGPGLARSILLVYGSWQVAYFTHAMVEIRDKRHTPSVSVWLIALLALFFLAFTGPVLELVLRRGRRLSLAEYRVYRGTLFETARKLCRKAGIWTGGGVQLYVLPEGDFAKLCRGMRYGAVVPRRLLDELNRQEIDSLAARQFAMQSGKFYGPPFWGLFLANGLVGILTWRFHLGAVGAGLTFLVSLLAELAALRFVLPRLIQRSEILSIRVAGEAGSFFTAQRALERLGGSVMPQEHLEEIGRRVGLSPQNINDLVGARSISPVTDCYPTVGSYLETGL
jgi:hypothetical protein